MRKLALAMALASTGLAGPALAKDGAWYVGVEGGGMIVENIHANVAGTKDAYSINTKTGWDVDGVTGYDFGMFRAEGEVSYKDAHPKAINDGDAAGRISSLSFMVNGLFDFGDEGLSGFVGGGAGVARVKDTLHVPQGRLVSDSDSRFAWQAIAGVRAALTDNIDVSVKYRFFNVRNVDLVTDTLPAAGPNGPLRERFRSHSILGGDHLQLRRAAATPAASASASAAPPRRLRPRRRRRWLSRVRSSSSSIGTSRTSLRKPRRSSTTQPPPSRRRAARR